MRTLVYVYGYYPEWSLAANGRIYLKKTYNLKGDWSRKAIESLIRKRFSNVLVRVQYSQPSNNFEYCVGN